MGSKSNRHVLPLLLALAPLLILTASGCVSVHSSGCKPWAPQQVKSLEQQSAALEAKMHEIRQKISKLELESGPVELRRAYAEKTGNVQKLRAELFSIERDKADMEGQVLAYENLKDEIDDSSKARLFNYRLSLEQTKAREQLMRELLAKQEAEAMQLRQKYALVEDLDEELDLLRSKQQQVQKRIDQLYAVRNPCEKN
ncbi:MAG: hypothetical protein JSU94_03320 [Phycisphaerales bacterium]|nr:MAG: hypothetical protein JSU94_03320 [Phycisphaerales bacterium]